MAIDSTSSSTNKRAREVEIFSNSDSPINSSTIPMDDSTTSRPLPQSSTDNLDGTLDIAWRDILHLLDAFRNYEPGYLSLTAIQALINTSIEEDALMEITRLREHTHMPSTLARVQFDKWTSSKLSDDLLTVPQLDIVLHFTDIIFTEFHMEIEMRTYEDKMTILQHLH